MNTRDLQRHDVDPEQMRHSFRSESDRLSKWVAAARRDVNYCNWVAQNALRIVSCGLIAEPASPMIPRALSIAGQALAGMFKVAAARTDAVSFPLDGQTVIAKGPVDESFLYPGAWIDAFFLNLLARQGEQMGWVLGFPRKIFRKSSTVSPKVVYRLVDASEAFWLDTDEADQIIEEAITSAERPRKDKWAIGVAKPILKLMKSLRRGGPEFESLLIEGLRSHKRYWTSTAQLRRDKCSFVAYELSALAGLAYDRGIPFAVDSDYLPMSLVKGFRDRVTMKP